MLLALAVTFLLVGGGLAVFHLVAYQRLFTSLQARGMPVGDLYLEGFDYGSRGCVGKLKIITTRLGEAGAELTPEEQTLFRRSKVLYYVGGIMAVPCSIILFLLFLWTR